MPVGATRIRLLTFGSNTYSSFDTSFLPSRTCHQYLVSSPSRGLLDLYSAILVGTCRICLHRLEILSRNSWMIERWKIKHEGWRLQDYARTNARLEPRARQNWKHNV